MKGGKEEYKVTIIMTEENWKKRENGKLKRKKKLQSHFQEGITGKKWGKWGKKGGKKRWK